MVEKIYEFLKKCGTYYLATIEGDQPRVRPFGTVDFFENKLYVQTGKSKNVSKQMKANPRIEICGLSQDMTWIRIEAEAIEDDRVEARRHMLDAYPSLKERYSADDGNCEVLYLKGATATIYSFKDAPKVYKF